MLLSGTDLCKTPSLTAHQKSISSKAVFQLLHAREKAFKEYRDDDRTLIKLPQLRCQVLQAFSDIVGEAVASDLFAGIGTLLDVRAFNTLLFRFHL